MLEELIATLERASRRWYLVRGLLRMLLKTAEAIDDGGIPDSSLQSLRAAVDNAWSPDDHLKFSSAYVNYTLARAGNVDSVELSDLLERWAPASLEDTAPQKKRESEDPEEGKSQ